VEAADGFAHALIRRLVYHQRRPDVNGKIGFSAAVKASRMPRETAAIPGCDALAIRLALRASQRVTARCL